ncbi:histidine phosphatase family protein [Sphingomonas sp. CJ99]
MVHRRQGRDFIARHGETVFNAARRLQGTHVHTPLTRAGFVQANAMGAALRELLGPSPDMTLWSSPSGRALQTVAIIAEHLSLDWHRVRTDERLVEIDTGSWGGRSYADIVAEHGPIVDPLSGLLSPAPDGETYDRIAARVGGWAAETAEDPGDRLVVMHGISSRVLRGVLTGLTEEPRYRAPIAPGLPQGSIAMVQGIRETIVLRGTGSAPA